MRVPPPARVGAIAKDKKSYISWDNNRLNCKPSCCSMRLLELKQEAAYEAA